jgi:hypothetical protein
VNPDNQEKRISIRTNTQETKEATTTTTIVSDFLGKK